MPKPYCKKVWHNKDDPSHRLEMANFLDRLKGKVSRDLFNLFIIRYSIPMTQGKLANFCKFAD